MQFMFKFYLPGIHRCSIWLTHVTRQIVAWIGRDGTLAWPPRSPDF